MEIDKISSHLLLVVLLIVAALLGGLVGFDGKCIRKEAGIRTYDFVHLGACSYYVIGLQILNVGDSYRIIANIFADIGFLGAGIIFRITGKYLELLKQPCSGQWHPLVLLSLMLILLL